VRKAFNAGQCETPKHPVSCILSAFYGHNTKIKQTGSDHYMAFPHLTTIKAGFSTSSYLFWAYRELGRIAALTLTVQNDGTLSLEPKQALKLPLQEKGALYLHHPAKHRLKISGFRHMCQKRMIGPSPGDF